MVHVLLEFLKLRNIKRLVPADIYQDFDAAIQL